MRIISGRHKGRKIVAPKNLPVRPTTDLAKESLFNILNHHFNFTSLNILDLFAGTGNISYEFLSRGAASSLCIDQHFACLQFIKKTAETLDLNISTLKSDVYKFLEKTPQKFDVIFADPPYDFSQEQFEKIVQLVFDNNLLEDEGMLIIEHPPQTKLDHLEQYIEQRKYGSSVFTFFEEIPSEEA